MSYNLKRKRNDTFQCKKHRTPNSIFSGTVNNKITVLDLHTGLHYDESINRRSDGKSIKTKTWQYTVKVKRKESDTCSRRLETSPQISVEYSPSENGTKNVSIDVMSDWGNINTTLTQNNVYSEDKHEMLQNIQFLDSNTNNPPAAIKEDATPLGGECVVCYNQMASFAFTPCMHLCVCVRCAQIIQDTENKCIICRKEYTNLSRIFFSAVK